MMTCEAVQEELVAYRDGELPEQDRARIAAHVETCAICAHEEAQIARVEYLLAKMERITPSPDFAATFQRRLEQEQTARLGVSVQKEHSLVRWWREIQETLRAWHVAPALAAAASLAVFFVYFFTSPPKRATPEIQAPPLAATPPTRATPTRIAASEVPAELVEKIAFYVNYGIISDLERFSHFEEIAAVELPPENTTELVKEENLPPELLQNPSFFAHYPLLQQMEKLQNLETVLDAPTTEEDSQGRG
jgi:negative regulator of sigma E activity